MLNEPLKAKIMALVVDDDKVTNDLICEFLLMKGFAVDPAFNGLEAAKRFNPSIHDLVITDLAMPLMNGAELIAILRERVPKLPIILITADQMGDWNRSLLDSEGVTAVLSRPLDLGQLAAIAASVIPAASQSPRQAGEE